MMLHVHVCVHIQRKFYKTLQQGFSQDLTTHTASFQSTFKVVLAPKFDEIPCTGYFVKND